MHFLLRYEMKEAGGRSVAPIDRDKLLLAGGGDEGSFGWEDVPGKDLARPQLKIERHRGIDVHASVESVRRLEHTLAQYEWMTAKLGLSVEAGLKVRAQVQTPIDLFESAGFAMRLQAVAELAAAVRLTMGATVGSFMDQVLAHEKMKGIPGALFHVFMEEAVFEGGIYGKAAVAVMAYANLVLEASLIPDDERDAPGFLFLAESGYGCEAGAGYRLFFRIGFEDVQRFLARSIDLLVDEWIRRMIKQTGLLSEVGKAELPVLQGLFKMAFRTAFTAGSALSDRSEDEREAGARCAQVIQQEVQRVLVEQFASYGVRQFAKALQQADLTDEEWQQTESVRRALAARLREMPFESFRDTEATLAYWRDILQQAVDLGRSFADLKEKQEKWEQGLLLLWAAVQALMSATARMMNEEEPSVVPLTDLLTRAFNRRMRRPEGTALSVGDAWDYLIKYGVDRLLKEDKVSGTIARLLQAAGDGSEQEVLERLLRQADGPVGPAGDARAFLREIVSAIREYLNERIEKEWLPDVTSKLEGQGDLKDYFLEVVWPALRTMIDKGLHEISEGVTGDSQKKRLREMCSIVLIRVFSRSLAFAMENAVAEAQREASDQLRKVSDRFEIPEGATGRILDRIPVLDELSPFHKLQKALEAGADVLAPFSDERREQIRTHLLASLAPSLAGKSPDEVWEQLADPGWMPGKDAMFALLNEMGEETVQRFERFVQAMTDSFAAKLLDKLLRELDRLRELIGPWLNGLREAVDLLVRAVGELENLVARLQEMVENLDRSIEDGKRLLQDLIGNADHYEGLRQELEGRYVQIALDLLDPFNLLGPIKKAAKKYIRDHVPGEFMRHVYPVLIRGVGSVDIASLGVRSDQFYRAALSRVEGQLQETFEGRNPGFDLSFKVLGKRINLGRVEVPFGDVISMTIGTIQASGWFQDQAERIVQELAEFAERRAELAQELENLDAKIRELTTARETLARETPSAVSCQIEEPKQRSIYSAEIPVVIQFPGVPVHFAESGDHRRVTVLLDGVELPLDSFERTGDSANLRLARSLNARDLTAGIHVLSAAVTSGALNAQDQRVFLVSSGSQ